jgi:hypothetical protein
MESRVSNPQRLFLFKFKLEGIKENVNLEGVGGSPEAPPSTKGMLSESQ